MAIAVNWKDIEPVPGARHWSDNEWAAWHKAREARLAPPQKPRSHLALVQRTGAKFPPVRVSRSVYKEPIGPIYTPLLKTSPIQAMNASILAANILRDTANRFQVTVAEIMERRRFHRVTLPRQIAMVRIREALRSSWSFPRIGRYMDNRDHTCIIVAIKRVEKLIAHGHLAWVADATAPTGKTIVFADRCLSVRLKVLDEEIPAATVNSGC